MKAGRWLVAWALVWMVSGCDPAEPPLTGTIAPGGEMDVHDEAAVSKRPCPDPTSCGGGGGGTEGYTVHTLPIPQGAYWTEAVDMNADRVVVGQAYRSGTPRAVVWKPLGSSWSDSYVIDASGSLESTALAINRAGTIVGAVRPPGSQVLLPFVSTLTPGYTLLPTGNYCGGRAYDINDGGTIVGYVVTCGDPWTAHGAMWELSGGTYSIRTLDKVSFGGDSILLKGVSASGTAVGYAYEAASGMWTRTFHWDGTSAVPLITPSPIDPMAITDGPVIGGRMLAGGRYRGVIWQSEGVTTLPDLGGNMTIVKDLDDAGFAVGSSEKKGGSGYNPVPVYWSPPSYALSKLPLPDPMVYGEVRSVNAAGHLAGWGMTRSPSSVDYALVWVRSGT